ncbi:putative Calpain-type cysteine protease DEK1 [Paratrimastix pyriformis]|uniref:Calpain-type cysteine protease DEK1 n=1 Tax=Paratrimastix pyriformis TaxID=342808 RepID=A0ABQ8UVD3_9EUKA|nr:putative Calpain-type cysteine protease DEK1 [Paratrimastix pyriformis]
MPLEPLGEIYYSQPVSLPGKITFLPLTVATTRYWLARLVNPSRTRFFRFLVSLGIFFFLAFLGMNTGVLITYASLCVDAISVRPTVGYAVGFCGIGTTLVTILILTLFRSQYRFPRATPVFLAAGALCLFIHQTIAVVESIRDEDSEEAFRALVSHLFGFSFLPMALILYFLSPGRKFFFNRFVAQLCTATGNTTATTQDGIPLPPASSTSTSSTPTLPPAPSLFEGLAPSLARLRPALSKVEWLIILVTYLATLASHAGILVTTIIELTPDWHSPLSISVFFLVGIAVIEDHLTLFFHLQRTDKYRPTPLALLMWVSRVIQTLAGQRYWFAGICAVYLMWSMALTWYMATSKRPKEGTAALKSRPSRHILPSETLDLSLLTSCLALGLLSWNAVFLDATSSSVSELEDAPPAGFRGRIERLLRWMKGPGGLLVHVQMFGIAILVAVVVLDARGVLKLIAIPFFDQSHAQYEFGVVVGLLYGIYVLALRLAYAWRKSRTVTIHVVLVVLLLEGFSAAAGALASVYIFHSVTVVVLFVLGPLAAIATLYAYILWDDNDCDVFFHRDPHCRPLKPYAKLKLGITLGLMVTMVCAMGGLIAYFWDLLVGLWVGAELLAVLLFMFPSLKYFRMLRVTWTMRLAPTLAITGVLGLGIYTVAVPLKGALLNPISVVALVGALVVPALWFLGLGFAKWYDDHWEFTRPVLLIFGGTSALVLCCVILIWVVGALNGDHMVGPVVMAVYLGLSLSLLWMTRWSRKKLPPTFTSPFLLSCCLSWQWGWAVLLLIILAFVASGIVTAVMVNDIFVGFSIAYWTCCVALPLIWAITALYRASRKGPLIASRWLLPVFAYNPLTDNVEDSSAPVLVMCICGMLAIIWGILLTLFVQPLWYGLAFTSLVLGAEVIALMGYLYPPYKRYLSIAKFASPRMRSH